MDKHDLLVALNNLAEQLGRTPTRVEFCQSMRGGQYKVETLWGNYATMLEAASLEPNKGKSKKITSHIFEKNIQKHLESYEPRQYKPQETYPTVAVISDIHWPFSNEKVLEKFYSRLQKTKPQYVILNGDAWDMYSHAKFPRSHNQFTPREEQNSARLMNESFWKEVQRITPHSKMYQLLGNHDVRPMKRIIEAYPEAEDWVAEKLKSLFTFEGVTTIFDARQELFLPGEIAVHHGYRGKLGEHRDYMLMNSVNGHTHFGGVSYRQINGRVLWELNSGFAGDPEAKGLSYTAQKISKSTPGFGEIDEEGPRFIAL